MTDRDVITRLQEFVAELSSFDGRDGAASLNGHNSGSELQAALARVANLEVAVEHRTVIGQATGIVMERYGISAEAAFAALRRISSTTNKKIYVLAQELVSTGHLEGL